MIDRIKIRKKEKKRTKVVKKIKILFDGSIVTWKIKMSLTVKPAGSHKARPSVESHVAAFAAVKNVIVKRNFNILFNRNNERELLSPI